MRRRRLIPAALLIALTGLSAGAIGLALGQQRVQHPAATTPQPMIAPSVGFAGYVLLGPVHHIQAQWAIPAITADSPVGHASTWIGVDDTRGDFIQLGSIEDRLSPDGAPFYSLFWSDTAHGDLAQEFAAASPGEHVAFDMTQTSTGWELTATPVVPNPGGPQHIASHYGAGVTFSRSLWLQENPVLSLHPLAYKPYPTIPSVTISAVSTNGRARNIPFAFAQAMATNTGGLSVPTKMLANAFTVLAPTGITRVYLTQAGSIDLYLNRFFADLHQLRRLGDTSVAARDDARQLVSALTHGDEALFVVPWSPTTRPLVARFIAHNGTSATELQQWLTATTPSERADDLAAYLRTELRNGGYSVPLRAALGLPPPS